MSIEFEFVMPIDRESGQPLWWKNLIVAHTQEGYKTRFQNYFYTWKNETYITSDTLDFFDRPELEQQVKNLVSSNQELVRQARLFFTNQIKFILSKINGYIENSETIEFDNYFRKIKITFQGEMIDGSIEYVILEVKL